MEISHFIEELVHGEHLSEDACGRMFQIIMNGGATPAQIAAVMVAMRMNGETVEEITGAVRAMRNKMKPFPLAKELRGNLMDTCGTGGDAKGTVNVSTAVAFVLAACGVKVAKHGNRAVSSRSGSSDVLQALGVQVDIAPEAMAHALEDCGICFLFAPQFHPAMRHVAPTRQELGMRTIFNLLGPLSNPAGATKQLLGVYDKKWCEPLAAVLHKLGTTRAWVVHGNDGMDELTTTTTSFVAELKDGQIRTFEVSPIKLGLEKVRPELLKGGDAQDNAAQLAALLHGRHGPYRDIVLLNAGAGLVIAEKAADIAEGISKVAAAIDDGRAKEVLAKLVYVTGQHGKEQAD